MSQKSHYWRYIVWSFIVFLGLAGLAIIVIPPMITLNKLKPKIETAIYQQTGIRPEINGNIKFSLLGRATISAQDVTIPNGQIKDLVFAIPLRSIFNIESAQLMGDVSIYKGNLKITDLQSTPFNASLNIYNTTVRFLDKDYDIIRATLHNGELNGVIRTDQHKYSINFYNNQFNIKNNTNSLDITGQLFSDGSARGTFAIETKNLNKWFQFTYPQIPGTIKMTAYFDWDGEYGISFSDINVNDKVSGRIDLLPDGSRRIVLRGTNVSYDMSNLLTPTGFLTNTFFDLDFYGDLEISKHEFRHLRILGFSSNDTFTINQIIADDLDITGGTITSDRASNILIKTKYDNKPATCLFYGTPNVWSCKTFTWDNTSGTISVNKDKFYLTVKSDYAMPDDATITKHIMSLGNTGILEFQFSDIAGSITFDKKGTNPKYTFAKDKTLSWLNPNFRFLPEFMRDDIGDFIWREDVMDFNPHSKRWFLSLTDKRFFLSGTNIKDLFPNIDLQSMNDMRYTISGAYNNNTISDLKIQVADHTFTGSMTGNDLTLKTQLINLDTFTNQHFIDNYEEFGFLCASPITLPFELNKNVYLSADRIIYNGTEYANFVYSLRPNIQTFSISDSARGNMLVIIDKDKSQYNISIQTNRFVTHGALLSEKMPLNISDSTITADIELSTYGLIAHDFESNLTGHIDLIFEGGYIYGIGTDAFYQSAMQLTRISSEYALSDAFDGGKSALKSLHITGNYNNGDFETNKPFTFQLRHTNGSGTLSISDQEMIARLDLNMRGIALTPVNVTIDVLSDGHRNYSLSEIMRNIDISYMRAFMQTHAYF